MDNPEDFYWFLEENKTALSAFSFAADSTTCKALHYYSKTVFGKLLTSHNKEPIMLKYLLHSS